MPYKPEGCKVNIREIIKYIIQNVPEILVVIIVSPVQVFMIERVKKWFPTVKKYKRGIFLSTLFSAALISFSVCIAGWTSWKSCLIVFLAIIVLSQAIYDQIVKRLKKKVGDE